MEAVLLARKREQGAVWRTWGRIEFAVVQMFQKFEEIRRHGVRAWKFDALSTKSSTLLERKRFKCKCYWRRKLQTLKRSLKCQTPTTCRRTWQRKQTTSCPWADRGRGRQTFRVRWRTSNPTILRRTLWRIIALQFGFRARDESRRLKGGDVTLDRETQTRTMRFWCGDMSEGSKHVKAKTSYTVFVLSILLRKQPAIWALPG